MDHGPSGTIYLCWLLLPHHLAMPQPALSTPGSTNFTDIIIRIRYSVNLTCKLLFAKTFAFAIWQFAAKLLGFD